jgi:DNA-binding NtrC family response regulator
LVREGKFREDLLYRLEAFTVEVPPLRERRDEIVPLAEHFLAINRRRWRTLPRSLSADAVRMLVAYEWPGNVRKLRNVIDRASVICAQDTIEVHHLPELRQAMPLDEVGALEQTRADTQRETLGDQLRTTELAAIRRALLKARGNQAEAARLLGIPRRTLSYKVQMFGAALQMPRDPREL